MKKVINDINEYFLPVSLCLNEDKLSKDFFFYKENAEDLSCDDAVNDWPIEKVRIFNSSTFYLINSVVKMINLWNNRHLEHSIELYLRQEIRNTCINISVYIDKVKNIMGYYFFLAPEAVFDNKEFIRAISQFKPLDDTIVKFIDDCKKVHKDAKFNWIYNIRNEEIHNESVIDKHNYVFENGILIPVDKGFKIDSEILLDCIKDVLELLLIIRDDVQAIFEKIPNGKVYKFIKNDTSLKWIILPESRADAYKNTAVFSKMIS